MKSYESENHKTLSTNDCLNPDQTKPQHGSEVSAHLSHGGSYGLMTSSKLPADSLLFQPTPCDKLMQPSLSRDIPQKRAVINPSHFALQLSQHPASSQETYCFPETCKEAALITGSPYRQQKALMLLALLLNNYLCQINKKFVSSRQSQVVQLLHPWLPVSSVPSFSLEQHLNSSACCVGKMERNFPCAHPSVRYYQMESIFTSITHIPASLHLDELGTV